MHLLSRSARLLVFAVVAATSLVQADEPDPAVRRIAYWGPQGSHDDTPDLLSDESIALVVLPDADGVGAALGDVRIVEFDEDGNITVSTWWYLPAKYVEQGNAQYEGVFLWEQTAEMPTPPPVGSHVFTGPDGLIDNQQPLSIKHCSTAAGCPPGFESAYHFTSAGTDGSYPFVIVDALFSR